MPNHNNDNNMPDVAEKSETVYVKMSPKLREKLEQLQKDEYRSTLSDTIRAILLKYFDKVG